MVFNQFFLLSFSFRIWYQFFHHSFSFLIECVLSLLNSQCCFKKKFKKNTYIFSPLIFHSSLCFYLSLLICFLSFYFYLFFFLFFCKKWERKKFFFMVEYMLYLSHNILSLRYHTDAHFLHTIFLMTLIFSLFLSLLTNAFITYQFLYSAFICCRFCDFLCFYLGVNSPYVFISLRFWYFTYFRLTYTLIQFSLLLLKIFLEAAFRCCCCCFLWVTFIIIIILLRWLYDLCRNSLKCVHTKMYV